MKYTFLFFFNFIYFFTGTNNNINQCSCCPLVRRWIKVNHIQPDTLTLKQNKLQSEVFTHSSGGSSHLLGGLLSWRSVRSLDLRWTLHRPVALQDAALAGGRCWQERAWEELLCWCESFIHSFIHPATMSFLLNMNSLKDSLNLFLMQLFACFHGNIPVNAAWQV